MRANPPSLYPLPDPVERAWQQSRALVMEVDMTHISQAQWQEMGAITRLVDGKTLKDHLPMDLYRRTLIAAGQSRDRKACNRAAFALYAMNATERATLEGNGD